MALLYRVFAVNKQEGECSTARICDGRYEKIEGLFAPLAANYARHLAGKTCRFEELFPPLPKQGIQ